MSSTYFEKIGRGILWPYIIAETPMNSYASVHVATSYTQVSHVLRGFYEMRYCFLVQCSCPCVSKHACKNKIETISCYKECLSMHNRASLNQSTTNINSKITGIVACTNGHVHLQVVSLLRHILPTCISNGPSCFTANAANSILHCLWIVRPWLGGTNP